MRKRTGHTEAPRERRSHTFVKRLCRVAAQHGTLWKQNEKRMKQIRRKMHLCSNVGRNPQPKPPNALASEQSTQAPSEFRPHLFLTVYRIFIMLLPRGARQFFQIFQRDSHFFAQQTLDPLHISILVQWFG